MLSSLIHKEILASLKHRPVLSLADHLQIAGEHKNIATKPTKIIKKKNTIDQLMYE